MRLVLEKMMMIMMKNELLQVKHVQWLSEEFCFSTCTSVLKKRVDSGGEFRQEQFSRFNEWWFCSRIINCNTAEAGPQWLTNLMISWVSWMMALALLGASFSGHQIISLLESWRARKPWVIGIKIPCPVGLEVEVMRGYKKRPQRLDFDQSRLQKSTNQNLATFD